jgi:hypothetical protein
MRSEFGLEIERSESITDSPETTLVDPLAASSGFFFADDRAVTSAAIDVAGATYDWADRKRQDADEERDYRGGHHNL